MPSSPSQHSSSLSIQFWNAEHQVDRTQTLASTIMLRLRHDIKLEAWFMDCLDNLQPAKLYYAGEGMNSLTLELDQALCPNSLRYVAKLTDYTYLRAADAMLYEHTEWQKFFLPMRSEARTSIRDVFDTVCLRTYAWVDTQVPPLEQAQFYRALLTHYDLAKEDWKNPGNCGRLVDHEGHHVTLNNMPVLNICDHGNIYHTSAEQKANSLKQIESFMLQIMILEEEGYSPDLLTANRVMHEVMARDSAYHQLVRRPGNTPPFPELLSMIDALHSALQAIRNGQRASPTLPSVIPKCDMESYEGIQDSIQTQAWMQDDTALRRISEDEQPPRGITPYTK